MHFKRCLFILLWWSEVRIAVGVQFNAETFSEISILAKQGKIHLDSLSDKAKVSKNGNCWKNAIAELEVGCKFLSEQVQNDLALRFTDCFLQMSGYEPVNCDFPKSACTKKLSDRAFNVYTEFFTHTQSICYFLESRVWQEEAEKTVNKLSFTSQHVSKQLEEAEKIQLSLLNHQKESLFIQNDLEKSSKTIASVLKLSQEKINAIMQDFQSSTSEQKQMLSKLFDNLLSLKSWAVNEISWFSSVIFFVAATIISFIFTSVSRTRGARIYILLILALNFMFERLISSMALGNVDGQIVFLNKSSAISSWIWVLRKFSIFLSSIVTIYVAFSYYDYNILNYQLLREIKNQNAQILKYFENVENNKFSLSSKSSNVTKNVNQFNVNNRGHNVINQDASYSELYPPGTISLSHNYCDRIFRLRAGTDIEPLMTSPSSFFRQAGLDQIDYNVKQENENSGRNTSNLSVCSEKSKNSEKVQSVYNLRRKSHRDIHAGI